MVTFVCPRCGATQEPREVTCTSCGFDIRGFDDASYDEKLLTALFHPEPDTALRAAFLLSVRRPLGAVDALSRRFYETDDPFLQGAIIRALDAFGGPDAEAVIGEARAHPSFIVREAALRCRHG